MRTRWLVLLCLLCLAGVWFFWPQPATMRTKPSALQKSAVPTVTATSTASNILAVAATNNVISTKTNQFVFRLSNTTKSLDQLMRDSHAILLENALIDSSRPLNLSIPKNLQSPGDPGAYIVQARGPIDNAFRAMLARSGAEIVSYIPNDAYLVRAPAGVANGLAGNPLTQAVVPFEPYFKISSSMSVTVGQKTPSSAPTKTNRAAGPSLLALAVKQLPLPAGTCLTLGLFKDNAAATVAQIEKLGGRIIARDNSPFGPVVRVQPPADWIALAALAGVQIVEPYHQRIHANDLSRATVGVAADTLTPTNYLGLTGKNVMVEVNDSGIDATHPDLTGRVFGDSVNLLFNTLVDTDGHGTHVAGTIAGDGTESMTVTNAQGSSMPPTNGQFRGMAPLAKLLAMDWYDSDQELQEAAARTNALISNNSWNYGDSSYDLAAASYDAAVRDALPEVTGSQPVLFVFSAGNSGGGGDGGSGGNADTILSPATAKNVITVGALEQSRGITNMVTDLSGNQSAYWYPETDTSYQVAGYSSLGNVGVGTEGDNGRLKPDVVAPGSFVISTRSSQWDEHAYYNPTNYNMTVLSDYVNSGSENFYSLLVPSNVVQIVFELFANISSPTPFPNLPICIWKGTDPRIHPPDLIKAGSISIPPDSALGPIGAGWAYAVSNNTSGGVSYDLFVDIVTTNDNGNKFQVLSNLNNTLDGSPDSLVPPHYYRYESGTSMAAADVSGVLALMQDYFTNTLHATPSPALLKALLINGARLGVHASYEIQNSVNYEGWGLINLPDSLPPGMTNQLNAACASFFVDQSPTNALATGDSHTYSVTIPDGSDGQLLPLRVTLTWTDPPGDPAAAIKLVNSLELVVTNFSDPANPIVYYGNDITAGQTYNTPETTNTANYDSINNVQNVFIPWLLGTQYSITVIGRSVNVNAVTAQTNNALGVYAPNVVQDYALVISCGEGEVPNAFTVTDNPIVSNPTSDQQITYVVSPDAPYLNQLAGASTPLLGTNTILLTTNGTELNGIQLGGTNLITLGMTNQWHFYVMTNPGPADFTNAAFITFLPETLSIPRMGVFADSTANATRPEADIDLYVSSDPTLMNLNPVAISNADKSVGRGGTEFVYYTDSAPGKVYYVGVYSEDQQAAQYGFIPIFTDIPFSQMNSNGAQVVNGLVLPSNIPDGSTAHPGVAYIFALAIYPMEIQRVVMTNVIAHQNFGDLIGGLKHGGQNGLSATVIFNNHDSLGNTYGPPPRTFIYDDSGQNNIFGARPSDGPGSLNRYVGQQGIGPWMLTEVDDSQTQTGRVAGFNLLIEPHRDLKGGVNGFVEPMGWWYGYIDVPSGTASLTISATNTTPAASLSLTPPLELYIKDGAIPTLTDTNEYGPAGLTNSGPLGPGNSITISSPPPGRYWVGLYNGSVQQQSFYLIANLGLVTPPAQVIYTSAGPVPILDDAVATDSMYVTADQTISSVDVALRVDHPRISDLVFHLISPDGTRVLLVENRGGNTANMGATIAITNMTPITFSYIQRTLINAPSTNVIDTGSTGGTLQINYNFWNIQPDEMVVYYQGSVVFDSGVVLGGGVFNVPYGPGTDTKATIVMNPAFNPGYGDRWDYTVDSDQLYYAYLVLTENTNLTTTPIKFAPVPFNGTATFNTNNVWHSSFEGGPAGDSFYNSGDYFTEGWHVDNGGVKVLTDGGASEPTHYLDLDGTNNLTGSGPGTISTNLVTSPGQTYILSFAYSPNPFDVKAETLVSGVRVLQNTAPLLTLLATNRRSPGTPTWATTSIVFTATSASTKLVFQSLDGPPVQGRSPTNGVLLDAINLATVNVTNGDIYYQPEQSLDTFKGLNSYGEWQLEVWDNRAGAYVTNLCQLASWQLRFNFPTPGSPVGPITITNGVPQTNTIPAGGIAYFAVTVPLNADMATNILLFATGPLNIWFDTNTPSTTNVFLFSGTNGSYTLTTTGTPPLVPGSTYYLGVQNTNSFTVNYGIEMDFHFVPGISGPFAFTQPAQSVTGTSARLNGMATPNGLPATAWFQWGTNTFYGNQTPPVSVGTGSNVVYTAIPISGLLPNVPYHFRLVVSNALAVVYGFDQILDEANVVVWGADYVGQANVPSGLSNVVAIAGAYDHSLALKNNGTAVGWGDNTFGQANVPAGLNNLLALAGGEYYSMALNNGGTVAAWGANILGQTNVPAGLNNVVTIAGGTYSSLALRSDGTVTIWGASFFGLTNVPPGFSNAVAIAGGSYHNLAVKNDGTVVAWGDNSAGQTNVPAGLTNVVAIAGGSYHSLALRYDGTVVAWGDNSAGQTSVPAGLSQVVAVAAGGFHSLALKNDGTVVAWGDNTAGQASVPVGLSNVVAIASGYFHSLALTPLFNVNPTNPIVLNLTNGVPQTNSILAGGIVYYRVNVPANADFATNILVFTLNGPLNMWFGANSPTTNVFLFSGTNGSYTLSTTGTPPLVPGSTYYLGVQNTNSFAVTYGIEVDFHLLTSTNAPIFISGIIRTNIGGNFGFLLTWYAPANDEFLVQWTGSLTPPIMWNTFSNIVAYTGPPTPTNGLFTFFDDGSEFPFGPTRFYRLILLSSLTNGVPETNSVSAGGIDYFLINVPTNADFATNRLLSATGPVNLLFNQTTPPTGTNAGDYTLLAGATNGFSVLSTTSAPTNIVPGGTYRLGVQNTNSFAVSFSLEVDFHLLTSTNAPTSPIIISGIIYTNIGGTNGFLLQWQGPTNFQYEIQWKTNLAPVVWNTVLNPVINVVVTTTNGHYSWFDNGTLTGGFGPMKFYRVLGDLNLGPITGSGPTTNTVLAGGMSQAEVPVPASATSASNLLISATGPLNVWFNQTNSPTGSTSAGDFLMLSATNAGVFVLTGSFVPPLVPGTNYYLGFQNPGASNVTFVFQVAFGFTPPIAVSSFSVTATNGGVWLKWNGLTNYQYQVQWTTNLAPPAAWNTISNIVLTSTTGIFTFFDDGSLTGGSGPMKFYRLIVWPFMTPIPQTLSISSVTVTNITGTNDLVIRWSAPTNYQYGIWWTTNLTLPFSSWSNLASPVLTQTNSAYTFIDNGQTGPPTTAKFFRLYEY